MISSSEISRQETQNDFAKEQMSRTNYVLKFDGGIVALKL